MQSGLNNFDTIRYEYYRDREVAFVGFRRRDYLFREEFTARTWATRYDFPAFKDGRVKRDIIPDDTPSGAQGWFINMRREKFKDRRVREALINAFDFEWINKNIMYSAYKRTHSVFQNSPMMAVGKPDAAELALLEPFRGKLPEEVFAEPYVPPVTDASGQDRRALRLASQLLTDAGVALKDGKRVLPDGQPFVIEFLSEEPSFNPHHLAYIKSLEALGLQATLRVVDPVQYRKRVDDFDFDVTVERMSLSSTPGDSLRNISVRRRRPPGSRNLAGINDPAVDALVESDHRRKNQARVDHRLQGARPRHSRRALLGAALVSRLAPYRLLGRLRAAGAAAALLSRHSRHLVGRQGQGCEFGG